MLKLLLTLTVLPLELAFGTCAVFFTRRPLARHEADVGTFA